MSDVANQRDHQHIENRIGDNTPPWRTPQFTENTSPSTFFHKTEQFIRLYQLHKSRMNTIGTPPFFNLTNRPWCKTLSKALLASKDTQRTIVPFRVKYLTDKASLLRAKKSITNTGHHHCPSKRMLNVKI